MLIYLACSGMMFEAYEELRKRFCGGRDYHELRSYIELDMFSGHTFPRFGKTFFLDSGAFSAYSRGTPIRIEAYTEFLQRYGSQLDIYANLDAIPEDGNMEFAAERTWQHQLHLEAAGLKPLPVFHKGEPWRYLERYLEKYDYICLGGLVADSDIDNEQFFEHVWLRYLSNADGTPKVKVHAFGMTSLKLLTAYPWYSADSSTWLIHSKLGQVAIPVMLPDGTYDYSKKPWMIFTSDQSTARQYYGWHIDTIPSEHLEAMTRYLDSKGVTLADLRGYPNWRFVVNLEYWVDLHKHGKFATKFRQRMVELL